jgi:two-component system cell cycle sensor histidine kinase/response regulator CckA
MSQTLDDEAAQLAALFDGMAEGVVRQSADGAIIDCNRAAERILGLSRDQLMGRSSIDPRWRTIRADGAALPGADHPAMLALRTGAPIRDFLMGVERPDGEQRWISINAEPMFRAAGEHPYGVIATFRDVTGQRATELALHHERQFLTAILGNLPGTIVAVFDERLELLRTFGGTASTLEELVDADDGPPLRAAAKRCLAGEPAQLSARAGERLLELALVPLGTAEAALLIARDVSEREALRDRLSRQERLVTVGTLAAGVGHEINNPLQFVALSIEFGLRRIATLDPPPPVLGELAESLTEALRGLGRIREIVRGLRAFTRERPVARPVDLRAALEVAASMAAHEIKLVATLVLELEPVPPVVADDAQLSQIFVNLLVNAAQAFASPDPTRNRITCRCVTDGDARAIVTVSDNGSGIDPAVLPRIFDPFFTTKAIGTGTGLGLSICHGIVSSLGGEITCVSELGRGTTFRVALPTSNEELPAQRPALRLRAPLRGRVVVIDDEVDVLDSLGRVLREEHELSMFSSAREALDHLLDEREAPEAVLCDLMMPYISGVELHARMLDRRPEIARTFVFITGGSVDARSAELLSDAAVRRLEKPFAADDVLDLVAEVVRDSRQRRSTGG